MRCKAQTTVYKWCAEYSRACQGTSKRTLLYMSYTYKYTTFVCTASCIIHKNFYMRVQDIHVPTYIYTYTPYVLEFAYVGVLPPMELYKAPHALQIHITIYAVEMDNIIRVAYDGGATTTTIAAESMR